MAWVRYCDGNHSQAEHTKLARAGRPHFKLTGPKPQSVKQLQSVIA